MADKKIPPRIQGTISDPKVQAGYVPPRPPVSPIAKIKPTSPPPGKKSGEKKGK